MPEQEPSPRPSVMRDIQGLRAIAVLSVLVVHAGLPLQGGFVGVDMFFVISGYIITLMLLRERERSGNINLVRFYIRRIRRLAPALAVASVATTVLAFAFLSPLGPQQVTYQTALGASLALANLVIAINSGDYFGNVAERNALLHTWSLSVEEQFYLLFPLLMIVVFAAVARAHDRVRSFIPLLSVLFLGGLSLLSIRGIGSLSDQVWPLGYYGPLNRAWEFLAGTALALVAGHVAKVPVLLRSIAGLLGTGMIIASLVLVGPDTPFPGKWALLPVAGTVLLISSGLGTNTLVSRLLATKPLVSIGDWSYSLYLWHWPLIVVARALWPFSPAAPVIAAILSFVPAYASYRWVEGPFRRSRVSGLRPTIRELAPVVLIPILIAGLALGSVNLVLRPAMEPGQPLASRFSTVEDPDQEHQLIPCKDQALVALHLGPCGTTGPADTPEVLMVGDSHAAHFFPGLRTIAAPEVNLGIFVVTSPRPFGSASGVATLADYISRTPSIRTVIFSRHIDRDGRGLSPADADAIRLLAATGVRLFVSDDVPAWPTDIYSCAYHLTPAVPWSTLCQAPRAAFEPRVQRIHSGLETALQGLPTASLLETHKFFCDAERCRRADDQLLYTDDTHITADAARRVLEAAALEDPAFAAALGR